MVDKLIARLQGKSAEHFTAYLLLSLGYSSTIVNHDGFDIISIINGKLIRVEVKSSKLLAIVKRVKQIKNLMML